MAELDTAIIRIQADIDRLTPIVGDPEDVPDEHGYLPSDRRTSMLYTYREYRIAKVTELRTKISELDEVTKTGEDAERPKLRFQRDLAQHELEDLLTVPRLEPKDMCADCARPVAQHGYGGSLRTHPCAAWPNWAARMREVWRMLDDSAKRQHSEQLPPPSRSPSRSSLRDSRSPRWFSASRNSKEQFPNVEVRRGRANRWELWPRVQTEPSTMPT